MRWNAFYVGLLFALAACGGRSELIVNESTPQTSSAGGSGGAGAGGSGAGGVIAPLTCNGLQLLSGPSELLSNPNADVTRPYMAARSGRIDLLATLDGAGQQLVAYPLTIDAAHVPSVGTPTALDDASVLPEQAALATLGNQLFVCNYSALNGLRLFAFDASFQSLWDNSFDATAMGCQGLAARSEGLEHSWRAPGTGSPPVSGFVQRLRLNGTPEGAPNELGTNSRRVTLTDYELGYARALRTLDGMDVELWWAPVSGPENSSVLSSPAALVGEIAIAPWFGSDADALVAWQHGAGSGNQASTRLVGVREGGAVGFERDLTAVSGVSHLQLVPLADAVLLAAMDYENGAIRLSLQRAGDDSGGVLSLGFTRATDAPFADLIAAEVLDDRLVVVWTHQTEQNVVLRAIVFRCT